MTSVILETQEGARSREESCKKMPQRWISRAANPISTAPVAHSPSIRCRHALTAQRSPCYARAEIRLSRWSAPAWEVEARMSSRPHCSAGVSPSRASSMKTPDRRSKFFHPEFSSSSRHSGRARCSKPIGSAPMRVPPLMRSSSSPKPSRICAIEPHDSPSARPLSTPSSAISRNSVGVLRKRTPHADD